MVTDEHYNNRLSVEMRNAAERALGTFFCTSCRARKPVADKVMAYNRSMCKSCLSKRKAVDAARKVASGR